MLMIKKDRKEMLVVSAAALVLSFIYYGRFLHNFFAYDDYGFIYNNLHGISSILRGVNASLRIVSNSVWWPLYQVAGLNPVIYNLFNLVLHCANASVLYLLLRRLFNYRGYAILGSAVFLLSAAGSDAVFWKSANCNLICMFFYIIAVYNYIIYRQEGSRKHLWLSVVSFLFAMFSKEEAASMPFIIVLIEFSFFEGIHDWKSALKRCLPYLAVVFFFFLVTETFYYTKAWAGTPVKIRPLYSLLACWTVFFIHPHGYLKASNPAIYIMALGMVLSFIWVKDKKPLFFGMGWVFLSFLPQSISGITQFESPHLTDSISRYLYIPSAGSSVVWAVLIISFREKFSTKVFYIAASIFLSLFILVNYVRVQERGKDWRDFWEPMAGFMVSIKKEMQSFPPNSYVCGISEVVKIGATSGRTEQLLRILYKRDDIYWITDFETYSPGPGENAFYLVYRPVVGGIKFEVIAYPGNPWHR